MDRSFFEMHENDVHLPLPPKKQIKYFESKPLKNKCLIMWDTRLVAVEAGIKPR
jgi:hypothetical protein